MLDLHLAIAKGEWRSFLRLIESGANPCAIDPFDGNTVLHVLAKMPEPDAFKKTFGGKTVTDYVVEIQARVRQHGMGLSDLALLQNKNMDTAAHLAVWHDNWRLARHIGAELQYWMRPEHLRKNRLGLTEYELALVLYGIESRRDEIDAVFGHDNNVSDFLSSLPHGLAELKSVLKCVKLVKPGQKTVILDRADSLFDRAVEQEYPSHLSTLEDQTSMRPAELHELYKGRYVFDRLDSRKE